VPEHHVSRQELARRAAKCFVFLAALAAQCESLARRRPLLIVRRCKAGRGTARVRADDD
jgi:hypothetical protein